MTAAAPAGWEASIGPNRVLLRPRVAYDLPRVDLVLTLEQPLGASVVPEPKAYALTPTARPAVRPPRGPWRLRRRALSGASPRDPLALRVGGLDQRCLLVGRTPRSLQARRGPRELHGPRPRGGLSHRQPADRQGLHRSHPRRDRRRRGGPPPGPPGPRRPVRRRRRAHPEGRLTPQLRRHLRRRRHGGPGRSTRGSLVIQ